MANKKLFEDLVLTSTPLTTDRFALGKPGSAYKIITAADLKTWMLKDLPTPSTLLTKVVNIGAYDMNRSSGNAEKDVALGVPRTKIRAIVVTILSNTSGIYTMASPVTLTDRSPQLRSWWRVLDTGTNATIRLYSDDQGYFDVGAFNGNGPDNNRGYITVWYVS